MKKPEILAPAGDFERLQAAVLYGADAVYLGTQTFSLRAKAKNFGAEELHRAVEYAHASGVRVYVTANIFAHNEDIDGAEPFFKMLGEVGPDAVIISDPGLFDICKEILPNQEIHISTQANNTNYRSAAFWHKLGAKRIVLARELSVNEIKDLREKTPETLELEAFVHGAMCISYSGRCLLSSYMTDRDSNRGACSQPCRFNYELVEKTRPGETMPVYEDERGTYIFNSKDLCLVRHLPELINAGISGLKIEGRMKTSYYTASVVKTYREAVDDLFTDPEKYEAKKDIYLRELEKSSHRSYTTGFYFNKTTSEDQVYADSAYIRTHDFVGVVLEYDDETGTAVVEQRNKFSVGDTVEFLRQDGENFSQKICKITNAGGEEIESAPHAQQIIKIQAEKPVKFMDMLRTEIK